MEGKNQTRRVEGRGRGCAETTKPHTNSEPEGMARQNLQRAETTNSSVDAFNTEKSHHFLSLSTKGVFWAKYVKMLHLHLETLGYRDTSVCSWGIKCNP